MNFLSIIFCSVGLVIGLLPYPARIHIRLDEYRNLQIPIFLGTDYEIIHSASLDMSSGSLHLLPNEVVHYGGINMGPFSLLGNNEQSYIFVASAPNVVASRERKIGANFASNFASTVGRLMLVPSQNGESVDLVVGNFEPQEFCLDAMITVPALFATPARDVGMVYMSVSFLDRFGNEITEPTEPELFRFDPYFHVDWVPAEVMDDFQEIIQTDFGLDLYSEFTTEIQTACAEIIDRLPSIKYSIMDHNRETYIIDIILPPRDYVMIDASGQCEVQLLDSEGEVAGLEGHHRDTPNILGTNFLRQVAMLFDYRNRQFGFCEPL